MSSVTLKKVFKRYGKVEIVHGIDLEIADNEFTVLVGPSGCGKSTILRMIAGLEKISEGTIQIGDRVVNDVQPKARDIAMVFQNYALYPHMSVYENMAFSLKLKGTPKGEIETLVAEAAEILGLTQLLERKPVALSGGQRQRVAMGRAIVRNPKVFLFDEPLSNLDAQLRTQMRMEINKLHLKLETTTIYVTHDQIEAMTLADRIVILKDGNIMQVGSPIEVYERPANKFVASFIGNPSMNFLVAKVKQSGDGLCLDINGWNIPVPEKNGHKLQPNSEVLMGIRPEDIELAKTDGAYPDSWKFAGDVLVTETLGGESLLEILVNNHDLVAKVGGHNVPKRGEKAQLVFNLENLHVFDPKTEQSIY